MNWSQLDPNVYLLGPKRPFEGTKTDQILIFEPKKRCTRVPFVTTEDQIGGKLSALITQQRMEPFWNPKGPLEAQKLINNYFWAKKGARGSPL